MSTLINKLKVARSEGMSGIGADQGALDIQPEQLGVNPHNHEHHSSMGIVGGADDVHPDADAKVAENAQEVSNRAPNSFGGPSFGRTSKVPKHKSELLNKLDPRVGYDEDEVRQQDLERYEAKYGKPSDFPEPQLRGVDMAGIGPDQTSLRADPEFRKHEREGEAVEARQDQNQAQS